MDTTTEREDLIMNQHQKEVTERLLQRARGELRKWERTLDWAADHPSAYERARLGVLKYRETVDRLQKKLA